MRKYILRAEDENRLERDFVYHRPTEDQIPRYQAIRDKGKELAQFLMENCPPSRELSLALTDLEMAIAHANMSIARWE